MKDEIDRQRPRFDWSMLRTRRDERKKRDLYRALLASMHAQGQIDAQ